MQRDPITFLSRLAREYGDVVHFTFGPQHLYFFNHPDAIREVLVTIGGALTDLMELFRISSIRSSIC